MKESKIAENTKFYWRWPW